MLYPTQFADSHLHAYAPFDEGILHFGELADRQVTDANLLAYTYIETGIDNNLVCLCYREIFRKINFRVYGGLYYDPALSRHNIPFKEQAELLLDMGCEGIKLLDMKPNYQLYCGITMDDPAYDDMYDILEARGIPIVAHLADPARFWDPNEMEPEEIDRGWCFADKRFLTQQQIFDCTLRRMEKNPRLHITFAHFGFMSHRLELCHEICEKYPFVTFDLAPGHSIFVDMAKDIKGWRAFFQKYSTRILYGTDTCSATGCKHIQALQQTMLQAVSHDESEFPVPHHPAAVMRGLDLDETAQRNICRDNYFRITPPQKSLDRALYREHAAVIRSIAQQNGDASMTATVDDALHRLGIL